MRKFSLTDNFLIEIDRAINTLSGKVNERAQTPGEDLQDEELDQQARVKSGRLLRVNHCGEICAQALYRGQRLSSKNRKTKEFLEEAASEEIKHLGWCEKRLNELGTKPSIFNPLFYATSFLTGVLVGMKTDKFSLGFTAETERQVMVHLNKHISSLPNEDKKSKAILEQMRLDEENHKDSAIEKGGEALPRGAKNLMTLLSKVMTKTTYWV